VHGHRAARLPAADGISLHVRAHRPGAGARFAHQCSMAASVADMGSGSPDDPRGRSPALLAASRGTRERYPVAAALGPPFRGTVVLAEHRAVSSDREGAADVARQPAVPVDASGCEGARLVL